MIELSNEQTNSFLIKSLINSLKSEVDNELSQSPYLLPFRTDDRESLTKLLNLCNNARSGKKKQMTLLFEELNEKSSKKALITWVKSIILNYLETGEHSESNVDVCAKLYGKKDDDFNPDYLQFFAESAQCKIIKYEQDKKILRKNEFIPENGCIFLHEMAILCTTATKKELASINVLIERSLCRQSYFAPIYKEGIIKPNICVSPLLEKGGNELDLIQKLTEEKSNLLKEIEQRLTSKLNPDNENNNEEASDLKDLNDKIFELIDAIPSKDLPKPVKKVVKEVVKEDDKEEVKEEVKKVSQIIFEEKKPCKVCHNQKVKIINKFSFCEFPGCVKLCPKCLFQIEDPRIQ